MAGLVVGLARDAALLGKDHERLLEHGRLPVGRDDVLAQVLGADAKVAELVADADEREVVAVDEVPAGGRLAQVDDARLRELPHERDLDAQELGHAVDGVQALGDLLVIHGQKEGLRAKHVGRGGLPGVDAVQLLLDDREGQEAVLLQVENSLEAPDVPLRVQAVATGRPRGVQEPLVLEVAHL